MDTAGPDASKLVERFYGPVFSLARRLLGSAEEARDAAQETSLRALQNLSKFQPDRSFRAWIFSIAANHIRDLYRKKRPMPLDSDVADAIPQLALPDERILREEHRGRLLGAIDKLPFDLKIVVELHFHQELSAAEMAEVLAVTPNAVRIRLYRALNALRKEMS